jgi:IgGFc binding protein/Sulfatase-modifying factor enzyme 1/Putative metal-binding motif
MRSSLLKKFLSLSFLISTILMPFKAFSEELDPAIYLLVDTSGSMLMTIDGSQNTYGDGSSEHPHVDNNNPSRLHTAKEAITQILNSYGEVRWGLARFQQKSGHNYICMCHDEIPNNTSGCGGYGGLWDSFDDCQLCDMYSDYPDYDLPGTHDRVCINYGGGILDGCVDPISNEVMSGADILVSVGGSTRSTILSWIDHEESDPGEAGYNSSLSPESQVDPELRAVGGTPIGGSLSDLYDQLANVDLGNDSLRGCRPYSIIVLTDGAESCGTDPITLSTELLSVPDLQHSCSTDSECPTNSSCNGSNCVYEVKTYVIAFAVAPNEFVNCNDIAVAGNTGGAIPANNTADLVSAMAGIIADSIRTELCNGIDDDCDSQTDEGYNVDDGCNNGLLGECYREGTYQCTADETASECDAAMVAGSAEVCDDLDNDCNGLVDDGISCPDPGPEMCDGVDNDGDGEADDGSEDPAVNVDCGTNEGLCTSGKTKCVAAAVVCCVDDGIYNVCVPVQGPVDEICDGEDNDCDGAIDEGVSRSCYPAGDGCSPNGDGTFSCLGICSAGIEICTLGTWGSCSGEQTPQDEVCDNADNDCDGPIDEGLGTTTCGLGECVNVINNCESGVVQTCNPMLNASPETCDTLDNDCDGIVDDGLFQSCYTGLAGTETKGVCKEGIVICSGGDYNGACVGEVTPTVEICNNLDDDCNDSIDDNLSRSCYTADASTLDIGLCQGGTQTCGTGSWSVCSGEIVPVVEVCDTYDNDCNGVSDDMGSTTCGLGVCLKTVSNCTGGTTNSCDPMAEATSESCDSLDNDCDGQVDGMIEECYPSPVGCSLSSGIYTCEGLCSTGMALCTDGSWGACGGAIIPAASELCDGYDNDCNGFTDEGLGTTDCGLGECAHTVDNCSLGAFQTCDPLQGAVTEICDNKDNDCDGITDEGLIKSCYVGSGCVETPVDSGNWSCEGICSPGNSICSTGLYSTCDGQVSPTTEICNNLDDNCDGTKDEGLSRTCYSGPEGTAGEGVCIGGTQDCAIGSWGSCVGEVIPSAEICDTLDNDCNGNTDDMGTLNCGLGECNNTVNVCESGALQTCNPLLGAQPEDCDGLDNDCDGQVDGMVKECFPITDSGCVWNNLTDSYDCEGVCSPGMDICPVAGTGDWDGCSGSVVPSPELCDGLDNNCDGSIDENLSQQCYPPGSGASTGCTDDGSGVWTCLGECSAGVRDCSAGGWSGCNGLVTPTSEICDNLDNDCDGEIDEDGDIPGMGQPCGGVGICAPGVRACIAGNVICEGGGDPQAGLCDGLDNNCNGLVDEPEEIAEDSAMGAPCGETVGACSEGHNECIDGSVICVGAVVPTTEICNGIDDDCNDTIDEGDICDTSEICYNADCRNICDPGNEQSCPAGFTCIGVEQDGSDYSICYPQLAPCGGIYCNESEVCRDETCVNPCDPTPCQDFEDCWVNRYAGQVGHLDEAEYICFDTSCSGAGRSCPSGKMCIEHECIDDPCKGDPCTFGQEYCVRVGCADGDSECGFECEPIPYCRTGEKWDKEAGKCVLDSCADIGCEYGELCIDGSCETDPCAFETCDWSDVCLQGSCIENPCNSVVCPYYTACVVSQEDGNAWCEPKDGLWVPPVTGDSMTSTGSGLFSCSTGSHGEDGSGKKSWPWLLVLMAGLLWFRWRGVNFLKKRILYKAILPLIMVSMVAFVGCDYKQYTLSQEGEMTIPDAEIEPDVPDNDAGDDADACIAVEETCNGIDDDCNSIIDDYWTDEESGGQGHFVDDIFNCGSCGTICAFVHADAHCTDSECTMGECDTNWYDYDGDSSNGCETSCIISSGGQEICDGVDNDCNGTIDDNWVPVSEGGDDHFMDDPMNCGECARICAFPNGDGGCVTGACILSGCQDGYKDADGQPGNGCECIVTGADDSTCDGVDNDCDGSIDEDFVGEECYAGSGCTSNGDGTFSCQGLCSPGNAVCMGGQTQCLNQTSPSLEICDSFDNDCDGLADEGFDTNTDVSNCGLCGNQCALSGALSRCESGACIVSVCQQNFWDNDGVDSNGCEYSCTLSNNGIERCDDGFDNDCDGVTDEFDSVTDVNNCGSCGYSCAANTPPHQDVLSCTSGSCNYICSLGYHNFDGNDVTGCETYCVETNSGVEKCDGADNNCDGVVDEGFFTSTDVDNCGSCDNKCSDSIPANMEVTGCSGGACQYACLSNHYNYDGILSNGCEYDCVIDNGGDEACDNKDNDCDGMKDEDIAGVPLSRDCYTGPNGTKDEGLCVGGSQVCSGGAWGFCGGEVVPVSEVCDSLDNNCDGSADETFDKDTDILNCGLCNRSCIAIATPNTYVSSCISGDCQYECLVNYSDSTGNRNTIGGDGCESYCKISNGGIEDCSDSIDNDCDGDTDEFDPNTITNCGSCGNSCAANAPAHMDVTGCPSGTCTYECTSGYHDYNSTVVDGCEAYCVETEGGTEICDGIDNDCNGIADDNFDTTDDVDNCGYCGYSCSDNAPDFMAVTGCSGGVCQYSCLNNHYNLDGILSNGCEYACTIDGLGTEECDGEDDDCDGQIDEDAGGLPLSEVCYTGSVASRNKGLCIDGTKTCSSGSWGTCLGEILPASEICDGLDNDCDSSSDEDFDTDTDLLNCGLCANSCFSSIPSNTTVLGCNSGACEYTCKPGWHDIANGMTDGCEYGCDKILDNQEYCNGKDDDCDGQIDEVGDLIAPPSSYCKTGGGCGVTVDSTCYDFYNDTNNVWVCQYPDEVELEAGSPNGVAYFESLCDGFDNDCDTESDEDFLPILDTVCDDGDYGLCKGTGTIKCKLDESGTECNITSKLAPESEECDGIDNDCDGLVDEPSWNPGTNSSYVIDDVVDIVSGGEIVTVFQFEASRPLATAADAGSGSNFRACSKPSVKPWATVTYEQARLACQKSGMNLCSDADWEEACDGSGTAYNYPYGDTFNAGNCNGEGAGIGEAVATGSMPACDSNIYGIEDLSGNLREWTTELISYNDDGKAIYRLKGGSYRDTDQSLMCSYDNVGLVEDAFSSNVGFRCCTRCGNGTLEAGELCDDGNFDNGDGCNGVCAPDSCGNGVVEGIEECDCGLNSSSLPGGCIDINGASISNCSVNCIIPEERCSALYPDDQDDDASATDCDDPDCLGTWCSDVRDDDGDGFAEPDDCDDSDPDIHPAAQEICGNGIDENCNGNGDDIDSPDNDGDGVARCVGGVITDCDDWDSSRSPNIPEICGDGIDNNCDTIVDSGCASLCEMAAYERSYIGCEYYAVTNMNTQLSSVFDNNFALVVSNPNSTAVSVTVSKGAFTTTRSIPANDLYAFELAYDATLKNTKDQLVKVVNGAYHIVSDIPVTVYQFNPFDFFIGGTDSNTNDAALVLPVHVLTRDYMVTTRQTWMGFGTGGIPLPGFFTIIGTENGTTVDVKYNGHAEGDASAPDEGDTRSYTLDAGEVIQVPSRECACGPDHCYCDEDYDFTGTTISVTNVTGHEVAVFAGHDCTFMPADVWACDHMEEQMFPLSTWGKNYIATYTEYEDVNWYRVVASEADTDITFSDSVHADVTLVNAGDYVEFESGVDFTISGDKPIAVLQFLLSQDYFGTPMGDPAMALLVPMEQFRSEYYFTVPDTMTANYVNIIKPVGIGSASINIDGTIYTDADFTLAIGYSYHGVMRLNISTAPYSHTISSDQPFGIMVYGFANYTSYFYPGGLDLNEINAVE